MTMGTRKLLTLGLCYLAIALIHQSLAFAIQWRPILSRDPFNGGFNDWTFKNESRVNSTDHYSFVLLGASGDLSKREIYPALWSLYRDNLLPERTRILGYARNNYTVADLRNNVAPYVQVKPEEQARYDDFWNLNAYIPRSNSDTDDYNKINEELDTAEAGQGNRIFYMALPPAVFPKAATQIRRAAMAKNGWTRVVIEKPFGRDLESSEELSKHLSSLFSEDQIYRMDHFLGYEMVQNLLTLRFANRVFAPSWNSDNIAAVKIDFKENFGIEGRGSYFDSNGIIRDVMQNHLLQIMSLIAMEQPFSNDPDDIRDAKVKLLRSTREIVLDNVVLGQYVGNPESSDPREAQGYLEDSTVPAGSLTATFALTVLKVDNERWRGVPFIIRAGKGLDVNRTEIRIQYKNVDNGIFQNKLARNELVIRVGRTEALQAKITSKKPGLTSDFEQITVDFDYMKEYNNPSLPGAYERLILDIFRGSQMNFVRSDELSEAWRIFTPILHEIEEKKIRPIDYKFGSTGPREADDMEVANDFVSSF